MDNQLLQNTQALLATVLSVGGAYGIYAVKNIFSYFLTKTTIIKDTEARNVADNALLTLDTLLETNITYAENTLKQPIIDMIADGKVTKDELKSLGSIVKTNVLSQLTKDSKTALSKIATNVEDFVEKRLETVLGNLKVDDSSSVSKTTVQEPEKPVVDTTELENQLSQANTDKQNLTQQNVNLQANIDSLAEDKNNLSAQNAQLSQQVQDLQSKLTTIQNAVATQTTATDATSTVNSQTVTQ